MPLFSHAKNSGRVRANCVRLRPAASQLSTMTTYLLTYTQPFTFRLMHRSYDMTYTGTGT